MKLAGQTSKQTQILANYVQILPFLRYKGFVFIIWRENVLDVQIVTLYFGRSDASLSSDCNNIVINLKYKLQHTYSFQSKWEK